MDDYFAEFKHDATAAAAAAAPEPQVGGGGGPAGHNSSNVNATTGGPTTSSALGVVGNGWAKASTATATATGAYPHCPIYIPSKGRSDQDRGTMNLLVKDLVPFTAVVEAAEADAYSQMLDHMVFSAHGAPSQGVAWAGEASDGATSPPPQPCASSSSPSSLLASSSSSLSPPSSSGVMNGKKAVGGVKRERDANADGGETVVVALDGCYCCRACAPTTNGVATTLKKERKDDDNGDDDNDDSKENESADDHDGGEASNSNKPAGQQQHQRQQQRRYTARTAAVLHRRQKAVSLAYHHGYVFHNTSANASNNTNANAASSYIAASTGSSSSSGGGGTTEKRWDRAGWAARVDARVATSPFTLRTAEEVRELFQIAILPRGGCGVSYVRNYILQTLVPQVMVAAGVDRTGSIDELDMFGARTGVDKSADSNSNRNVRTGSRMAGSDSGGTNAAAPSKALLTDAQIRALALDPSFTSLVSPSHSSPSSSLSSPAHNGTGGGGGGGGRKAADGPLSRLAVDTPAAAAAVAPHNLFGYYWVMDDDIFSLLHAATAEDEDEDEDENDASAAAANSHNISNSSGGGSGESADSGSDSGTTTATATATAGTRQRTTATATAAAARKNIRISPREMMRQVSQRVHAMASVAATAEAASRGGGGDRDRDRSGGRDPRQATLAHVPAAAALYAAPSSPPPAPPLKALQQRLMVAGGGPRSGGGADTAVRPIFTGKDDCETNNPQTVKRQASSSSSSSSPLSSPASAGPVTALNLSNFTQLPQTACISLEYSRFAYTYDDTALACNSYNNIACLFNYFLLHSPREVIYFPQQQQHQHHMSVAGGVRSSNEVLGCGVAFSQFSITSQRRTATSGGRAFNNSTEDEQQGEGENDENEEEEEGRLLRELQRDYANAAHARQLNRNSSTSMVWYKYTIREDYDFTLQLIARGMCTLRFRNLSFEVPQMAKLRGGMTDYYKTCSDEIRQQNALFVAQWPSVAVPWTKGKNVTERDDIKVRWDLLHPSRARHPGAFLFLSEPLRQLQAQQMQMQAQQMVQLQLQGPRSNTNNAGGGGGGGGFPSAVSVSSSAPPPTLASAAASRPYSPRDPSSPLHAPQQQQRLPPVRATPAMTAAALASWGPVAGPSLKEIIAMQKGFQGQPRQPVNLQQQQQNPQQQPRHRMELEKSHRGRAAAPTHPSGVTRQEDGKPHSRTESDGDDNGDDGSSSNDDDDDSSSDTVVGATAAVEVGSSSGSGSRSSNSGDWSHASDSGASHGEEEASEQRGRKIPRREPHAHTQLQQQLRTPLPPLRVSTTATTATATGWKGYAVEAWRDLAPAEAAALGLHQLSLDQQRVGGTVAIVPTSFAHSPSCVLATLIERSVIPGGDFTWTAVVQRVRGMPLLSVPPERVYAAPPIVESGGGVAAVAAAVDDFFARQRREAAAVAGAVAGAGGGGREGNATISGGGGGGAHVRSSSSSWLDDG